MRAKVTTDQLDKDGYRKNVGIIVCNRHTQVLWARRVRHDGWQFPQGGIEPQESARDAAFRELYEEIGLNTRDVYLLGSTERWLRYEVPYSPTIGQVRHLGRPGRQRKYPGKRPDKVCQFRGQKQRWFLFKLIGSESCVNLHNSATPEFDQWCWVNYWQPLDHIVEFKRAVYKKALTELEPLLYLPRC